MNLINEGRLFWELFLDRKTETETDSQRQREYYADKQKTKRTNRNRWKQIVIERQRKKSHHKIPQQCQLLELKFHPLFVFSKPNRNRLTKKLIHFFPLSISNCEPSQLEFILEPQKSSFLFSICIPFL